MLLYNYDVDISETICCCMIMTLILAKRYAAFIIMTIGVSFEFPEMEFGLRCKFDTH
jgi:hypothetical protein